MSALAKAASSDLFQGRNSVCCLVGGRKCGKTEVVFGSEIARSISNTNGCTSNGNWEGAEDVRGLLPQILDNLVSLHEMKCQISIVEVVDDDTLRDVLGFSHQRLNEHDGHSR